MEALNAVDLVDARDDMNVLTRMRESFEGWPKSSSFDSERGGEKREVVEMPYETGDPNRPLTQVPTNVPVPKNDPVGEAVARGADRAANDRKLLERAVADALRASGRVLDLLGRYSLRDPSAFEESQTDPEPGCVSCARVTSIGTVGKPKNQQTSWWNSICKTTTLSSGIVVGLCRFCYDSPLVGARFTGEMPSREDVESYRDSGRARKRAS